VKKINWFKITGRKFGLTELELKVVFFLSISFCAGLFIKVVFYSAESPEKLIFDYSKQDSAYYSGEINEKNVQKRVDSKQELLDFSGNNSFGNSEEENVLLEKSININTADIELFMKLPGIGIKTAEKIVILRNIKSGFQSVDELIEVKGIGAVKLNRIKKYIFVDKNK